MPEQPTPPPSEINQPTGTVTGPNRLRPGLIPSADGLSFVEPASSEPPTSTGILTGENTGSGVTEIPDDSNQVADKIAELTDQLRGLDTNENSGDLAQSAAEEPTARHQPDFTDSVAAETPPDSSGTVISTAVSTEPDQAVNDETVLTPSDTEVRTAVIDPNKATEDETQIGAPAPDSDATAAFHEPTVVTSEPTMIGTPPGIAPVVERTPTTALPARLRPDYDGTRADKLKLGYPDVADPNVPFDGFVPGVARAPKPLPVAPVQGDAHPYNPGYFYNEATGRYQTEGGHVMPEDPWGGTPIDAGNYIPDPAVYAEVAQIVEKQRRPKTSLWKRGGELRRRVDQMSRLYSTAMGFVNYGPLEDPNMALNEAYQRWVENPSTNPTRLDYELAAQAAFAMEQERKQLLSAGSFYEPQAIQAGKDVEYWRNIALSSPFLGVKLGSSDVLDLGPKGKKIADFLARNRARKALRDARKTQDRPDLNPTTTNIPDDQPAPATTILRPEPTSEPTDSTTEPSEPKRSFLDSLRALRNKVIGEPDTDSSPTPEPTPVSEPEPTPEPERPRVSPALIREPRPQPGIRTERTRPTAGPPARPTREAYEQRVSGQVLNPNDYD